MLNAVQKSEFSVGWEDFTLDVPLDRDWSPSRREGWLAAKEFHEELDEEISSMEDESCEVELVDSELDEVHYRSYA